MTGPETSPTTPGILTLCTGNAARSVMAGFMFEYLAELGGRPVHIVTAGTHTVDGQPMSIRTRAALVAIPPLADVPVSRHRSHQLEPADLESVDVVVAMEADHVRYVRRRHPEAAGRTATIRRLVRDLAAGPEPLAERLARLELATVALSDDEDVVDPAGGDEATYRACADQLWSLTQELAPRLF
jgi:protein-tyrosine phosphatase